MTTHRGRTKKGKKPIIIHLSVEEYDLLCKAAEMDCRSATMQATYMILKHLRQQFSPETRAALYDDDATVWDDVD